MMFDYITMIDVNGIKLLAKEELQSLMFVTYGITDFESRKVKPVENTELPMLGNKPLPYTGFWASPFKSQYGWFDLNCDEDCVPGWKSQGYWLNWIIFHLRESAKIMVIDNLEDFLKVKNRFETFENSGMLRWKLDYERMVHDGYNGLFLTYKGLEETKYEPCIEQNMNGWDCESICLFDGESIILDKTPKGLVHPSGVVQKLIKSSGIPCTIYQQTDGLLTDDDYPQMKYPAHEDRLLVREDYERNN